MFFVSCYFFAVPERMLDGSDAAEPFTCSGAKGFGLPTACGGMLTPKSLNDTNTGSEKILLSSVTACRLVSAVSNSAPEAPEESVATEALLVSESPDGDEK